MVVLCISLMIIRAFLQYRGEITLTTLVYVAQCAVGDVVLRLKGDCGDYFSPIGAYTRIIGLKVVNQTNPAWSLVITKITQGELFPIRSI